MLILLHHMKVIWHSLMWCDCKTSKENRQEAPVPEREDVPQWIVLNIPRDQGILTGDKGPSVHSILFTCHTTILWDKHAYQSHFPNESVRTHSLSYFPEITQRLGCRSLGKQRGLSSEWTWKLGLPDPELAGIKESPFHRGRSCAQTWLPTDPEGPKYNLGGGHMLFWVLLWVST